MFVKQGDVIRVNTTGEYVGVSKQLESSSTDTLKGVLPLPPWSENGRRHYWRSYITIDGNNSWIRRY